MQRRQLAAVIGAAEAAGTVGVGPERDQRLNRARPPAGRGPGQGGAPVDIGVEVGAVRGEDRQHRRAVAARGPGQGLIERLLRIVCRSPLRHAGVRPVEGAVREPVRGGPPVGADQAGEQVSVTEPSADSEVARRGVVAGEQIRRLTVAPEQRHDQRGPAVAAATGGERRAGGDQRGDQVEPVAVGRLVQGRPAVPVGARRIGAAGEQQLGQPHVAGGSGHAEQIVAVGSARENQARGLVEQLSQGLRLPSLERPVGTGERRRVSGQSLDGAGQGGPVVDAMRGGQRQPGTGLGQRRAGVREGRHRGWGAVTRRGEQPGRTLLVVPHVRVIELGRGPGHRCAA